MELTIKQRNTILIAAGATGALMLYLFWDTLFPKKVSAGNFQRNLAAAALYELAIWNNGTIKEGDPVTMERLRQYWREGAGVKNWSDKQMTDEAWSAALISFVVKAAGGGNYFKYSPSHSVYIRDAIKNRKENNNNPFKGYKPEEAPVQVGDIIARGRQSGVTYDTTGAYMSHGDVVTAIKNGVAETVGGNVGQSVSITRVPLTQDGKIDNTKVKGYPYFVVIKKNMI